MSFTAVFDRHQTELDHLVDELGKGRITPEEFGDRAYHSLARGHTDAYAAGLRHAGSQLDPLMIQHQAEQFGRAAADGENHWLDKFVADLENGRYLDGDGNLHLGAVTQRANMYALKLRASGNQAFVDASSSNEPDEDFDWVMEGIEHCHDCPRMAALSPYKAHELFTVPGQGDTECLSHCQCILVRHSDGLRSFSRP